MARQKSQSRSKVRSRHSNTTSRTVHSTADPSQTIVGRQLSAEGLAVAGLFLAFSLFPSMLPRSFVFQGLVSAVSLAIGYGLGVWGLWLWRYLQIPALPTKSRAIVSRVLVGLIAIAVLASAMQSVAWQNTMRSAIGMPHIGFTFVIYSFGIALVFAALLIMLGRSIRKLFQWTTAKIDTYLPRRLSIVLGVVVMFVLFNFLYAGVLGRLFFGGANVLFSARDVSVSEQYAQPQSALTSGGPGSLAHWDTLGREGRRFVATVSSPETIQQATGDRAQPPIRVYVGLKSADTLDQRADLVLKELIRTKAFERRSLLLATSTGTGWLDAKSIEPFEYMNNGDTAVAGIQYSFLPSWISLLADQQTAKETSGAVFTKVYDYWQKLPEDHRPKLYLYGLSLGSFGAEEVLKSVEFVNEPISGALLAGPPFVNELQTSLENQRQAGSPAWQPIVNDGRTVRFVASPGALGKPKGTWGATKIVYVQHATDPIVWFSPDLLLHRPAWLERGNRGPAITKSFHWVPIVTMWQMAADLPAAGAVPQGYGHNYAALDNFDPWVALTSPPNWTAEKNAKLKAYFAAKEL